jgi:sugar-specific transcriptional regulator TrmB
MMTDHDKLKQLGFSQYEISCYLTLAAHHPINGSQLSRMSGMARSRVYDVLRNMVRKGYVMDVGDGKYVPLPPEELYKRLQHQFDEGLAALKSQLNGASADASYEFIWMIRGYERVIAKAKEMIGRAEQEIYVRLFPDSADRLIPDLRAAQSRGVGVRFISMGPWPEVFDIQVAHPDALQIGETIGGRSFDIITDKAEALVGIFEKNQADASPINWTRNRWFVVANRDSLRHDFYHCFLEKIVDRNEPLTADEKSIYAFIKADN